MGHGGGGAAATGREWRPRAVWRQQVWGKNTRLRVEQNASCNRNGRKKNRERTEEEAAANKYRRDAEEVRRISRYVGR